MTDRLTRAISQFLDSCAANQMAFEPQRAFTTTAEAEEAGLEFWIRYAELYRAIGREPPARPQHLPSSAERPMI